MSSSDSDDQGLPDAETCDRNSKEFAEVTGTDEACAHFFLQDHSWNLQNALNAFFETESESGEAAAGDGAGRWVEDQQSKEESSEASEEPCPMVSSLKLISWNVDGIDEKNLTTRMKAVCTILLREKPEVVFLQEVVAEAYSVIDNYMQDDYLLISGRNESSHIPYFTVMLLDKKKIRCRKQQVIPFKTTMMGRTLLTVEADINNGMNLVLIAVHLESTRDFERERKKQLSSAFQTCLSFATAGKTVIFGGDLNARDKEIDEIGGIPGQLEDVWKGCGSRKFTEFTWDRVKNDNIQWEAKFKPRCRFDRIYINKTAAFQPKDFMLVGTERIRSCLCFPSDHWGIMSTFQMQQQH